MKRNLCRTLLFLLVPGAPAIALNLNVPAGLRLVGTADLTQLDQSHYLFSATGLITSTPMGAGAFQCTGQTLFTSESNAQATCVLDFGGGNTMTGSLVAPTAIITPEITGSTLTSGTLIITSGTGNMVGSTGTFTLNGTAAFSASSPLHSSFDIGGGAGLVFTGGLSVIGYEFVPIAPCRVVETRGAVGPLGGPALAAGIPRDFPLPNGNCSLPTNAVAYSLNVTVVPQGPLGYLTTWPTGQTQPVVSTLNSQDGSIKANAAIVPAGTNGSISVFATNPTQLILDVDGYFVLSNSISYFFYPLNPCRVFDTRNAAGSLGGPWMPGGTTRTFPITLSPCGVPPSARAYSLNVTAVPGGGLLSYLTAFPTGTAQPLASTLNAPGGAITANADIVRAGTNGNVDIFVTDSTNVVADINGVFAPAGQPGALLYHPYGPCRLLDTRDPAGPFGSPALTNSTRNFALLANHCGLPPDVEAVSVNVTVVPRGALNYLTLWPSGQSMPTVSTLNALNGLITSNAAIVPLGADGSLNIFANGSADVIVDLNGFFSPEFEVAIN